MIFKGKVSWWFYAIIIGVAALLIPIIIVSAFIDPNVVSLILNLIMFIAIELFSIAIALRNYVKLQNETLIIVFGFIKKKISYNNIVALSSTNNPSSSLAASLDRIEIKCKNQSNTMISLINKEQFFNEIKKYNPNITIM